MTERLRRINESPAADRPGALALSEFHPAIVEGRTLFPTTVVAADQSPRVLIDGVNQRKIGGRVTLGPWRGFPVYCLTLEERKTCPASCHNWSTCYGNGMHLARRHEAGPALEAALDRELSRLARLNRRGFVVRLHILGDFYSVPYVERWRGWLERFASLHVYGYTAWAPDTEIGAAIAEIAAKRWDRFAIRFSSTEAGPGRVITLWNVPDIAELAERDIIVCPAQTGATETCGTCGLCWSESAREKTIAFVAHGARGRGSRQGVPSIVRPYNRKKPAEKPPAEPLLRLASDLQLRRVMLLERALLDGEDLAGAFDLARRVDSWIGGAPHDDARRETRGLPETPTQDKHSTEARSSLLDEIALSQAIAMFKSGSDNDEIARVFDLTLRQAQGMRMGLRRGGHI